jgi:hypothetical protein
MRAWFFRFAIWLRTLVRNQPCPSNHPRLVIDERAARRVLEAVDGLVNHDNSLFIKQSAEVCARLPWKEGG